MMNFETTGQINMPVVPPELIVPFEELHNLQRIPLYKNNGDIIPVDWYRIYKCNNQLIDWVREHCPVKCSHIEYIVSDYALLLHRDNGRSGALNYVIDTGGDDIFTEFYNSTEDKLLDRQCYKLNTWYYLNVSLPHRVIGNQTRPRYLLSVTPADCVTYTFDWASSTNPI